MSHKMISDGFIAKQPPLIQVGNTVKIEFDICSKRSARDRKGSGWIEIPEYVSFVAWGEEAERLADKLVPGREVSAIGLQETSSWTDKTTGHERSKVLFRLVHLDFVHRGNPQRQSQQQGNHGEYQGGEDNSYAGEPEAPRHQPRYQNHQRPVPQGRPAPQERYANQQRQSPAPAIAGQGDHAAAGHAQPQQRAANPAPAGGAANGKRDRFSTVY